MIDFLKETFEQNFEEFKLESGRSITPSMKEYAWQQVNLYWMKLSEIAKQITETEVHLILPDQVTPENRKYTIEGIVDIIQEEGQTIMYDIKTHRETDVKANQARYQEQLNVYTHIWQQLRNNTLDKMAIIATAPPVEIRSLMSQENRGVEFLGELEKWNPVVELPFDQDNVKRCIESFGKTVDKIENREFTAPNVDTLRTKLLGQKAPFGTAVCRHCDARYSCHVYEEFICTKKIMLDAEVQREIELEQELEKEEMLAALGEE